MGEVYLAEDTNLRRKVALKLLPPQFSADNERKNRFEKEARAVSALNHPNIITIYEIGEAGNISYMATEFIDGHTLRDRIAEKPFEWQETIRIAIQVAGALESAHLVGIIHRDIKPANIMIRGDGIVKVLDFGLAKLTATDTVDAETRENTAPHRVMGTINYMSPEQALGERIDSRTDIFSFGVVVYEMLTGQVPFAGSSDERARLGNGLMKSARTALIIDDEKQIRRLLRLALEGADFQVFEAETGQAGLSEVVHRRPDVRDHARPASRYLANWAARTAVAAIDSAYSYRQ
jgi:serine/threonine protein kinase